MYWLRNFISIDCHYTVSTIRNVKKIQFTDVTVIYNSGLFQSYRRGHQYYEKIYCGFEFRNDIITYYRRYVDRNLIKNIGDRRIHYDKTYPSTRIIVSRNGVLDGPSIWKHHGTLRVSIYRNGIPITPVWIVKALEPYDGLLPTVYTLDIGQ